MNLATGGQVSLNELVALLNKIMEMNVEPIYDDPRSGDILHSRAGIDRAQELLDFSPIVTFEEGLRRTVEWYRANQGKV
jgi:nucleoside-diphosphate-sugar epimerase